MRTHIQPKTSNPSPRRSPASTPRWGCLGFYVSVVFHEIPRNSLFIGGVARNDFVRISIDHIARSTLPEDRQKMLNFLNSHIDPFVKERGFEWELHIDETPRDLWTVQGLFPPPSGSEEEQRWARENRPCEPTG